MHSVRTILLNFCAITLALVFITAVDCQLTFSPDWGKRSVGGGSNGVGSAVGGFFDTQQQQQQNGNCKTSNEMLMEIFRFVQAEAQHYLDCKHRD